MQKRLLRLTASIVVVLSCATAQAADILYQTPGPNPNSPAYFSDADGVLLNAVATKAQVTAGKINGVEWWGLYADPNQEGSGAQDFFTLSFYAGGGATPGALVGSFALGSGNRVATGNKPFNYYNQYFYSASFADFDLSAGPYFVSIVDANPSASDWAWQEIGSLGGVGGASRNATSGIWAVNPSANTAFRLTYTEPVVIPSPVPEPETYALMLAGLGLLAVVARRRKAARH